MPTWIKDENLLLPTESVTGAGWAAQAYMMDGAAWASAQYMATPTGAVSLVDRMEFASMEEAKAGILRILAAKLTTMLYSVLSVTP